MVQDIVASEIWQNVRIFFFNISNITYETVFVTFMRLWYDCIFAHAYSTILVLFFQLKNQRYFKV